MYYIVAKEIVAKCIEVGILQAHEGGIFVYHDASQTEPEKYPEENVVHSLMADAEGQRILLEALEEKGVSMQYRIEYWDKMLNNSPFN